MAVEKVATVLGLRVKGAGVWAVWVVSVPGVGAQYTLALELRACEVTNV